MNTWSEHENKQHFMVFYHNLSDYNFEIKKCISWKRNSLSQQQYIESALSSESPAVNLSSNCF